MASNNQKKDDCIKTGVKKRPWQSFARAMAILCVFSIFFLITTSSVSKAKENITINIQGIEGQLYDNVVANLEIYEKREAENLSSRQIKGIHEKANNEISKALEPFGYYSPQITSELKKTGETWKATYRIELGEPVRVESVSISFEAMEKRPEEIDKISRSFPLKRGSVLEHPAYAAGKKLLLQQLFTLGYLDSEYAKNEILIDRKQKKAKITLVLNIGKRYLFGDTTLNQNLIKDELLRRFLNYRKGEPYSPLRLSELQRILYKTNYFGQVIVKGEIEKTEGLYVPISLSVYAPEYYNRYSFGLGYATDDGFRGILGWDNRLLNTSGHTLTSKLKLAERESSLNLIYGIPVYNPRFDKLLYGASYNEESWGDTDIKQLKSGLSFDHAGSHYKYSAGVELIKEEYTVGTTDGDSFLPVPQASWSVAIGDNLINTKHGLFASIEVKGASESLFSDASFYQGTFSGKIITTPFEGLRLIGRGSLGATHVNDIEDLPPSLRFYAGGDQSVRGYAYKDLGPVDSSGYVIGGKYLIFASMEAEKIITDAWSLAAFFDTGSGVEKLSDDLKEGVGVGVRYRLPFGQIRLDLASAISEDGNPLRVHLTVGGDL